MSCHNLAANIPIVLYKVSLLDVQPGIQNLNPVLWIKWTDFNLFTLFTTPGNISNSNHSIWNLNLFFEKRKSHLIEPDTTRRLQPWRRLWIRLGRAASFCMLDNCRKQCCQTGIHFRGELKVKVKDNLPVDRLNPKVYWKETFTLILPFGKNRICAGNFHFVWPEGRSNTSRSTFKKVWLFCRFVAVLSFIFFEASLENETLRSRKCSDFTASSSVNVGRTEGLTRWR